MGLWGAIKNAGSSFGDWFDGPNTPDRQVVNQDAYSAPNYRSVNNGYNDVRGLDTVQLGQAGQASMGGQYAQQQGQLGRMLMDRANGQGLVSEQLARRGTDDAIRAQSSFAAGARPGNSALAARQAMQNASSAMAGLAGERALSGAAESAQAAGLAGNVIGQARGQEMAGSQFNVGQQNQRQLDQAGMEMARRNQYLNALQGQGQAGYQQGSLSAQGEGLQQQLDQQRAMYAAQNQGAGWDRIMNLGSTLGGAALMSDRRAKKDITDARPDADRFLKKLHAKAWTYKDRSNGEGRHVGVMAQDLEQTVGKRAVIDTPRGKMVDYNQLAPVLTAALGRLGERVEGLEKKGGRR